MGHGEEGLSPPPPPPLHWLGGGGCWHFRPWNCQIWVYQQLSSLQLFWIIRDPRFQKRLWILEFSATSVKIWFVFGGFRSVLYVISRFLAFELQSLLVSLYSCQSFLPALYRNMASLNSQGEIVLIELPNPGETQIWEGENELVRSVPTHIYFCSFCSWLPLFFDNEGLDAMVTVWLTSKRNPKSWNVFDDAGRVLSETAVNDKESVDLSSTTLG